MNSTEHIHRAGSRMNRLMKWPLFCGLLGLAPLTLMAGDFAGDTYINNAIVTYPGTETHPPMIDATNFINNGTFSIDFTTLSVTQPFYETSDTVNFTNNGVMTANTGFRFDTRYSAGSGLRAMAGTFNNQGTITCGSANDLFSLDSVILFFGFGGFGDCLVNATNIISPGVVDAGLDGLIQFNGQNVDLSHSTLSIEGSGANPVGTGVFGVNTNNFFAWDPSLYLGPTYAESAFFPIAPLVLFLTNSTAYIDVPANQSSNNVIRAVFIEDDSRPSVPYNIYFRTAGQGFGPGSVTIEWVGGYQDPATGNTYGNYLYLNDDYILGASTNVALINGFPDNFTLTASPTQLPLGVSPAAPGFVNVFPAGVVTNGYAYGNIQLISSSVSTNDIPNLSITNLPGRIQISAANELNLAAAQIAGANYLSVESPNQFDGSPGALIQAPYADLNVGVTNGFLTVSNLLAPAIPNWSGNIQAWSTRWITVDAGVTNDYRVVIVGSQLNPTTLSQVQDLILHGTNTITVCDALNIMRTFTADAQNLIVATNGVGNGATSLNGELNLENSGAFYGANSLPDLRNLTNNGAIRTQNLAEFSGQANVYAVTPGTPATAATGTLAEVAGSNVAANYKVIIGTNQYVFVSKLTNTVPNQVKVAAKFDGSMSNLIAAINLGAGAGTTYSSSTLPNAQVAAGVLTNHAFRVTAKVAGTNGNSIITTKSTTAVNVAWTGTVTSHLSGGADYQDATTNIVSTTLFPYDNFVNHGLLSDQGSTIWAKNFESYGVISNWAGPFTLDSLTTTVTNGSITAGGDISISAGSLVTSNIIFQTSRSVTLRVTNLLTDSGVTNGSVWSVQTTNGTGGNALMMPIKPLMGDLLGTTITNYAPLPNRQSLNVWAGQDRGVSVSGFTNNAAVGRMYLDALGSVSQFKFSGASISNALYVDDLIFVDAMTNGINNNFDFSLNLSISPNMMVYFAQATTADGTSIAAKIDAASKAGQNGGRLRWVPGYVGHFSSINLVYPDGTTNTVNAALAGSSTVDSNGNGIPNGSDPAPFFVGSQVGLNILATNAPVPAAVIQWSSIPGSTNYIYYKTNLASTAWLTLTNFVSSAIVPPAGGWPITNTVFDAVNSSQTRFYNVTVIPNSASLYGQ